MTEEREPEPSPEVPDGPPEAKDARPPRKIFFAGGDGADPRAIARRLLEEAAEK